MSNLERASSSGPAQPTVEIAQDAGQQQLDSQPQYDNKQQPNTSPHSAEEEEQRKHQQQMLNPAPGVRNYGYPDHFMMYIFKVEMCKRQDKHPRGSCPYAHIGDVAQRRHPDTYQALLCPEVRAKKVCPRMKECQCSHSAFEFWLHPDRYRTSMCEKGLKCSRPVCFFAHTSEELRPLPAGLKPAAQTLEETAKRQSSRVSSSSTSSSQHPGYAGIAPGGTPYLALQQPMMMQPGMQLGRPPLPPLPPTAPQTYVPMGFVPMIPAPSMDSAQYMAGQYMMGSPQAQPLVAGMQHMPGAGMMVATGQPGAQHVAGASSSSSPGSGMYGQPPHGTRQRSLHHASAGSSNMQLPGDMLQQFQQLSVAPHAHYDPSTGLNPSQSTMLPQLMPQSMMYIPNPVDAAAAGSWVQPPQPQIHHQQHYGGVRQYGSTGLDGSGHSPGAASADQSGHHRSPGGHALAGGPVAAAGLSPQTAGVRGAFPGMQGEHPGGLGQPWAGRNVVLGSPETSTGLNAGISRPPSAAGQHASFDGPAGW